MGERNSATLIVDGRAFEIHEKLVGQNVLTVCLSLKLDLPYFCWHPALGSVGACRQCAIIQYKDARDQRGKLVMACMTPFHDGLRISLKTPAAATFRKSVIEWLMTNHPHDCPVCDEGGECHLQDMTVMTGHNYRRYRFKKRTYRNQYLGPFIDHEMNRCIQCYRCVRFYRNYADGRDFDVFAAHNHVYFGRSDDGVLENPFSGNLVEICPTGVFTDRSAAAHYTRKWDLSTAPSICIHCGYGCNTIPGERYGTLRRILNRYNPDVNGYFLCDLGRFGYEFVNSPERIRTGWLRRSRQSGARPELPSVLVARAAEILKKASEQRKRVIGIGSPRASLESNFALRELVGTANFHPGMNRADWEASRMVASLLTRSALRAPTLREIEQADCILIFGEDVTATAPRLALAIRQAVRHGPSENAAYGLKIPPWHEAAIRDAIQDARSPLFVVSPYRTPLDDIATRALRTPPWRIPAVTEDLPEDLKIALSKAKRPLVVTGSSLGDAALGIIRGAAQLARRLTATNPATRAYFILPDPNSVGVALIADREPAERLEDLATADIAVAVILENHLERRIGEPAAEQLLERIANIILLDYLPSAAHSAATIVMPTTAFPEADGTFVSGEGRIQRAFQVFPAVDPSQDAWQWICELGKTVKNETIGRLTSFDGITAELARQLPVLRAAVACAPNAKFRVAEERVARQPHRYSGRTAMWSNVSVHEPKPADDPNSPFAFSMEGLLGEGVSRPIPSPLLNRYWAPNWNSVQALNKFQSEVGAELASGPIGIRLASTSDSWSETLVTRAGPIGSQRSQRRPGHLFAVPVPHLFGSEELSLYSPGIRELAPSPYVALTPDDASQTGLTEHDTVTVKTDRGLEVRQLPVRITNGLAPGCVAYPLGIVALTSGWCELLSERKEAAGE